MANIYWTFTTFQELLLLTHLNFKTIYKTDAIIIRIMGVINFPKRHREGKELVQAYTAMKWTQDPGSQAPEFTHCRTTSQCGGQHMVACEPNLTHCLLL